MALTPSRVTSTSCSLWTGWKTVFSRYSYSGCGQGLFSAQMTLPGWTIAAKWTVSVLSMAGAACCTGGCTGWITWTGAGTGAGTVCWTTAGKGTGGTTCLMTSGKAGGAGCMYWCWICMSDNDGVAGCTCWRWTCQSENDGWTGGTTGGAYCR